MAGSLLLQNVRPMGGAAVDVAIADGAIARVGPSLVAAPGVEVVASPPDVRPHVARAQVVVAPLQIARGIQNKVLEAMALGKPVLVSLQALEGIAAERNVHLATADNPQEWIDELAHLLNSPETRRDLAMAARRFVEDRYSWEAQLAPLGGLLDANRQTREQDALATAR